MPLLVRDTQAHIIGTIESYVYTKMVSADHFLRNPEPAIAIDAVAYDTVISRHAVKLRAVDREAHVCYSTTVAIFNANKKAIDRGHGRQYYLPIRLWDCDSAAQKRLV